MCDACVLMCFYPSKRLWHHFSNYSLQNAVSETQCPKTKKVWEMPGHQNQAKFFIAGILRAFDMLILHKFLKRSVWKEPGLVFVKDGMPSTKGCIYKSFPSLSHWVRLVPCISGPFPPERTRKWNAKESETTWVLVHSTIHLLIGIRKSFPLSEPHVLPL